MPSPEALSRARSRRKRLGVVLAVSALGGCQLFGSDTLTEDVVGKTLDSVSRTDDQSLAIVDLSPYVDAEPADIDWGIDTLPPTWTVLVACSDTGYIEESEVHLGVVRNGTVTDDLLKRAERGELRSWVSECSDKK